MAVRLRRPPEEETGARIEVVPLIDIMFFLLATFILATLGLTQSQALAPVRLPTSAAATGLASEPQTPAMTMATGRKRRPTCRPCATTSTANSR